MSWDPRSNMRRRQKAAARKAVGRGAAAGAVRGATARKPVDDVSSVGRNYNRKRQVKIGTALKITRKKKK